MPRALLLLAVAALAAAAPAHASLPVAPAAPLPTTAEDTDGACSLGTGGAGSKVLLGPVRCTYDCEGPGGFLSVAVTGWGLKLHASGCGATATCAMNGGFTCDGKSGRTTHRGRATCTVEPELLVGVLFQAVCAG